MRTLDTRILVTTDRLLNDTIEVGGASLYIGGMEDYQFYGCNNGVIAVTNPDMEALGLTIGTKVYAHHHCFIARDNDSAFRSVGVTVDDTTYYEIDTNPEEEAMYGYVKDGAFIPWGEYVFLEPNVREAKKEGGMYVEPSSQEVYEAYTGFLVYASGAVKARLGIAEGDLLRVRKDTDFLVDIEGRKLLRIIAEDILWKE